MKRPAYQWYPKDAKADEVFQLMTYEQRGIYRDLLDHQWEEGSIPADIERLSRLFPKITNTRFRKLWPLISTKFSPLGDQNPDRLANLKLGQQKQHLEQYIGHQRENGRKGGLRKANNLASATNSLEPNGSSSSSSSTATESKRQETPPPPLPERHAERTSALTSGLREHRNHACCGVVCLHTSLFDEFVKKSRHRPDPDDYVRKWFDVWHLRYFSGDRKIVEIGEDGFQFWRDRWAETHPPAPMADSRDTLVAKAAARLDRDAARFGARR